ncbi:MAG: hypothetical protein ACRC7R_10165 [Sarcina sp.]
MFIVYSKQTGDIKNIATGDSYNTLKDLFPYDYKDFEIIYDTLKVEDDLFVINNFTSFKVKNKKIIVKEENFNKYRE